MTVTTPALRLITLLAIGFVTVLSAQADTGIDAFENGDFAGARTALEERIASNAKDAEAYIYLGRTLMNLDDAKAAADALDTAIELAPDSAAAHAHRGEAYGTLAGNASAFKAGKLARKTRKAFERALEIDPNQLTALNGLIQYKLVAPRLMGGNKKEALELTDRLIAIDEFDGTLRKSAVLQSLERETEAVAALTSLTERYPKDPRAHYQLGFFHQSAKDYEQAAKSFALAGATTVDNQDQAVARAQAWYQLGRTAVFSEQNVPAGIDALSEYLKFDGLTPEMPGKDWAHYRLGELLSLNGDEAAAQTNFASAMNLTEDKNLKRRVKDRLN
ncbi:MAG: tetratricopeptide repeat protein [Gammaproteobacteria bacterium]